MNMAIADDGEPFSSTASREPRSVTSLDSWRRREENVLDSVTFFFGGRHCGTMTVNASYVPGTPLRLLIVPHTPGSEQPAVGFSGRLDCMITDDPLLADD